MFILNCFHSLTRYKRYQRLCHGLVSGSGFSVEKYQQYRGSVVDNYSILPYSHISIFQFLTSNSSFPIRIILDCSAFPTLKMRAIMLGFIFTMILFMRFFTFIRRCYLLNFRGVSSQFNRQVFLIQNPQASPQIFDQQVVPRRYTQGVPRIYHSVFRSLLVNTTSGL